MLIPLSSKWFIGLMCKQEPLSSCIQEGLVPSHMLGSQTRGGQSLEDMASSSISKTRRREGHTHLIQQSWSRTRVPQQVKNFTYTYYLVSNQGALASQGLTNLLLEIIPLVQNQGSRHLKSEISHLSSETTTQSRIEGQLVHHCMIPDHTRRYTSLGPEPRISQENDTRS